MERRLQDIERRIVRCQEAIEVSNSPIFPLVNRMEALNKERTALETKRQEIAGSNADRRKKRPDVDELCKLWQQIPRLWNAATDDERTQIMQSLVIRVEMEEKERGACDIALASQAPVHWLELNSHMGAPTRLSSNYQDRIRLLFEARKGGLLLRSSSDCPKPACG